MNEQIIADLVLKHRRQVIFILVGIILTGLGIFVYKLQNAGSAKIEIISSPTPINGQEITVEVSGEVNNPGVYKLAGGSRVDDALRAAGGLTPDADNQWVEKTVNKAAKVSDGQKIYIPMVGERVENSIYQNISGVSTGGLVNINVASQKELEALSGIGPVYAQNIIEQRPYSTTEDLLTKGVLKQNTYDKIKDKISVY